MDTIDKIKFRFDYILDNERREAVIWFNYFVYVIFDNTNPSKITRFVHLSKISTYCFSIYGIPLYLLICEISKHE